MFLDKDCFNLEDQPQQQQKNTQQGKLITFDDSDEDTNEIDDNQNNKNDFVQNLRHQRFNNQTNSTSQQSQNTDTTQDSQRPILANMNNRQKLVEQQKQKLLEKNRLLRQTQGMVVGNEINQPNQLYKNNLNNNQNKQQNTNINIENLNMYDKSDQPQYEPGTYQQQQSSIPKLDKQNPFIVNDQEKQYVKMDMDTYYQQQQQQQQKQQQEQEQLQQQQQQFQQQPKTQMLSSSEEELPTKEQICDVQQLEEQKQDQNQDQKTHDQQFLELVQSNVKKYQIEKTIQAEDIKDMRLFLTTQIPQGSTVQCRIRREKSGLDRFYPKYNLSLSNGGMHLMTSKKQSYNKTSNYLISMDKNSVTKGSDLILGKLRANFLGTEFNLYDEGENPKKTSQYHKIRKNLAYIHYGTNILGTKGPRKMKIVVPKYENGVVSPQLNLQQDNILAENMKLDSTQNIHQLQNKTPKWNEHYQAFVLNFHGRVDQPSVKNFQLVESDDGNNIDKQVYIENSLAMQFGKVGAHDFNMDFSYPLSPLQAFSICLSSFDYKLACE